MNAVAKRILNVKEAAESRRSIRKYKPDPIPREQLEEILSLALKAPSANNLQPWRIAVVQDPTLKERLREAANNQAQVSAAPTVLVIYSDMKDTLDHVEETFHPGFPPEEVAARAERIRNMWAPRSDQERETWGVGQAYILLGYLTLLLKAYGYDSNPIGGFNPAKVKEALDLPAHVAIAALLPAGIAAEEGYYHHRHPLNRVVQWR
ncbi:MAG: nitroreductase family protein [Deinococcota bacterium]|nr:nitroreductase family protein [Allomeiothermus silvanus]